ncbi:MAG: HAD-IIB family hydrolase [Acholeplasmataceae bacterium]|jgi:Cof subfamily protein (haloacid dehalogenase superfamily)|nr:HAD-IIB family hydrolase [Acholeplasmataceae bacterium]
MKTIIFFDVDNTLYNNTTGAIPEQTRKLLFELHEKKDVILGLATGRGLSKLNIIDDVISLFSYKVLVNGAYVIKDQEVIYDEPIKVNDVQEVLDIIDKTELNIGMVGLYDEAVNRMNLSVHEGMNMLRGLSPKVDPSFHLNHKIYQLWMFAEKEDVMIKHAKSMPKFKIYPWHQWGADFVYPHINKAFGIKKALEHETDYRLICLGDGANDIQMIEMADIGIAMCNTRFTELKEKADHIAPHIMDDQLYQFFQSLNLF